MKKYRFYIFAFIGVLVLFTGAFNSETLIGMILWGVGIIISIVSVLLQIIIAPNFNCPDCGAELNKSSKKVKFIKHNC